MRSGATALVAGLLFAAGLALSGMTHPERILAFLDVGGAWDPSLALVMGGAVGVYFLAYRVARRSPRPLEGDCLTDPGGGVDRRLVIGAFVFGVGWGLGGFCPGPAIVSLGASATPALWFVPAMIVGMGLQRRLR